MKTKIYKIYKLICLITNMSYIGQTYKSIKQRINEHIGSDFYIGKAIRKHEIKNFKVEILWKTTSKETANCIEKAAIKFYNTQVPNGYNLTSGGEGGDYWKGKKNPVISEANKKRIWTKESREKVGKASKGHKLSKESKKKCRESKLGNKNPAKKPGVGAKISKAKIGKKMSAKSKKNMKIARNKPETNIKRLKTFIRKLEKEIGDVKKET